VGIVTPFIGPRVRDLVNAGLARNIRCNLSQVPRLFEGRWRPQVAFAHTSPPDEAGRVTLGLNAGIDFAPVRQAMFKVAMVNAQMPRWHIATHDDPATGQRIDSGCAMKLADFDLAVEIGEPLFEHHMAPVSPVHETQTRAIARTIVDLLRRAAPAADATALPHTIQLGIGKIPNAVARELVARGASVRAVWSELFADGMLALSVPRRPDQAHAWALAARAHRRRLRARRPRFVRDDAREPRVRRAAAGDRQRPGGRQN
jgi:acyl-CoA hydrolase